MSTDKKPFTPDEKRPRTKHQHHTNHTNAYFAVVSERHQTYSVSITQGPEELSTQFFPTRSEMLAYLKGLYAAKRHAGAQLEFYTAKDFASEDDWQECPLRPSRTYQEFKGASSIAEEPEEAEMA